MGKVLNIDLALLRAFVEVADSGSMSAAAERLHLTQGAVSLRIKRLESFFGCLLLERDASGSRLSTQGGELLPDARRLLAMNDRLCRRALAAPALERVRLGLPFDMAGAQLAPLLKTFNEAFPQVEVKIISASSVDIDAAYARGEVDIALTQGPPTSPLGERLALDRLIWLGRESAWARRQALPLCFLTHNCVFRDAVIQRLADAGIEWTVVFENESVDTTLSMVLNDLAVTPWLRSLVPDYAKGLVVEQGLPRLAQLAIRLQVQSEASPALCRLADLFRAHYRS
ncbi:LysR family transcriptional regulator [Pseudomonas entomophila]|uniref:LysR substrate-binding domain-containing protein n=1 Tax=Pseudomonas entomophila TaxID=312306 RepID=UPI0023D83218|nr:LysR family transcriptional regulator [Pseudomonas entomophila]MDF0731786.1 LysR family transcriptional regulator [Pseudomonas entomophila]